MLLYLLYVCLSSTSVVSHCLQHRGLWPARVPCLWDFPGKDTGVGCHFLLQGVFCIGRQVLYQLRHLGSLHLLHVFCLLMRLFIYVSSFSFSWSLLPELLFFKLSQRNKLFSYAFKIWCVFYTYNISQFGITTVQSFNIHM